MRLWVLLCVLLLCVCAFGGDFDWVGWEEEEEEWEEEPPALDPLKVPATSFYNNGVRPAGTLLLNMLVKDEEVHLARTLPLWAKVIDYWVIGVDEHNTDSTPEVIEKALGHIPGRMVKVSFDGMGPTWTQVVKAGLEHYPQATHGFLADADFAPLSPNIDKMELDIRCSKLLYRVVSETGTSRKLDWIYRNVKGAVVKRRTHQSLYVPPLPQQHFHVCDTTTMDVSEQLGGYQDRSGSVSTKQRRYISWLEKDLQEMPNDSRTTYYLGMQNLQLFDALRAETGEHHQDVLDKALGFLKKRARGDVVVSEDPRGDLESQWWAILKVAEVLQNYYSPSVEEVTEWYDLAYKLDSKRAESLVNKAVFLRSVGRTPESIPLFVEAAQLPLPDRALFLSEEMYTCHTKTELASAVASVGIDDPALSLEVMEVAAKAVAQVRKNCGEGSVYQQRLDRAKPFVDMRLQHFRRSSGSQSAPAATAKPTPRPRKPRRRLAPFEVTQEYVEAVGPLGRLSLDAGKETSKRTIEPRGGHLDAIGFALSRFEVHPTVGHAIETKLPTLRDKKSNQLLYLLWARHLGQLQMARQIPDLSCHQFRLAVEPLLALIKANAEQLRTKLGSMQWGKIKVASAELRTECL